MSSNKEEPNVREPEVRTARSAAYSPGVDARGAAANRSGLGLLLSVALLSVALSGGVQAGEAIQFSPAKGITGPDLENSTKKEKLTQLTRKRSLNVGDMMDVSGFAPLSTSPLDRKGEKKLKNAKTEKENWVLLNQGELQEKDDQRSEFGVRDYSGDGIEKEKTTGELWFAPKQDRSIKGLGSASAASRNQGTARPAPAPASGSEETSAELNLSKGKESDGSLAGPATKESDLRTTFGAADQPEASLKDLFNLNSRSASSSSAPGSDDRARRRDDLGVRVPDSGPSLGNPSVSGRGFGLGRDPASFSPGPVSGPGFSPEQSRLSPSILRPGGFDSFAPPSGFNSPFIGSGPNNQPKSDFAPGSTRPVFGGK